MDKRKRIPDVLSISLFCAITLSATLPAGADNGLNEASRRVLAQNNLSAPQGQPRSGSAQPLAGSAQPAAPAGSGPRAGPSPVPAAPGTQPGGGPAPQSAGPSGGEAAAAAGGTAASPAPGTSSSGVVREKGTKETKESKEIKDHPSDLVGVIGALAWPAAIILLVLIILIAMAFSKTIQQLFGVAVSVVQKVEIAGVKLEIDTSVVEKVKKFLGGSLDKLMKKAII